MVRSLPLLAVLASSAVSSATAQYWNGGIPARSTDVSRVPVVDAVPGAIGRRPDTVARDRGPFDVPTYLYVGGGGITVWGGDVPYWSEPRPASSGWTRPDPCAPGIGGAASASSAIGSAPSAGGRSCR